MQMAVAGLFVMLFVVISFVLTCQNRKGEVEEEEDSKPGRRVKTGGISRKGE